MAQRCRNCGWVIRPRYENCHKCGADLSETAVSEESYHAMLQDKREQFIREWEENGGKKSGRLGCLIFFLAVASIMGYAWLLSMELLPEYMLALPFILIAAILNLILYKSRGKLVFEEKKYYDLRPASRPISPPKEVMTPIKEPAMKKVFCSQCGNPLGENDGFCGECGTKRGE